jgi:hypothetical protein
MTGSLIVRHALLANETEIDFGGNLGYIYIVRVYTTSMRGRIALANGSTGCIVGTCELEKVETVSEIFEYGYAPAYRWRLIDYQPLPCSLRLDSQTFGPVWARLTIADRVAISRTPHTLEDRRPDIDREGEEIASGADVRIIVEAQPHTQMAEHLSGETPPPTEEIIEIMKLDCDEISSGMDATEYSADNSPSVTGPFKAGLQLGSNTPAAESPVMMIAEAFATGRDLDEHDEGKPPDGGGAASDLRPMTTGAGEGAASPLASRRFFIETARERACDFIPNGPVSETMARQILIRLREEEIRPNFPEANRTACILRKSVLDRLIDEAIETPDDFREQIPLESQAATDPDQLEAYLNPILAILSKIQ